MQDNKKILILGGSSFIGQRFFSRVGPYQAVATYYRHPIEHGVYFDASNMAISDIVKNPEIFSHAILLLGDTNPDSCAKDVKRSTYLNVTRMRSIIDQLKAFGIIPVFMSTEAVFDGEKGDYIETDAINPILTYGFQKVQIEEYLQEKCERFLIIRLARVFGSERGDGTLFTAWLDQIKRNITISCARDHIFSPIHVDDVCEGLIQLIENDCEGFFHLSNKNAYCRSDMLKLLIRYYQRYVPGDIKIIECSLHDFPVLERRPLNISMRPDKIIKTTGLQIKNLDFCCREIADRWFKDGGRDMEIQ